MTSCGYRHRHRAVPGSCRRQPAGGVGTQAGANRGSARCAQCDNRRAGTAAALLHERCGDRGRCDAPTRFIVRLQRDSRRGTPEPKVIASAPAPVNLTPSDLAAAALTLETGQPAGRGVTRVDPAEWQFHAVTVEARIIGAMGLARDDGMPPAGPERLSLLQNLLDQIALALERARLESEARGFAALRERDRLRSALLGSMGQDVRPRLKSIMNIVGDLKRAGGSDKVLVSKIAAEAVQLDRYVSNLVELGPKSDQQPVEFRRREDRCLSARGVPGRRGSAFDPEGRCSAGGACQAPRSRTQSRTFAAHCMGAGTREPSRVFARGGACVAPEARARSQAPAADRQRTRCRLSTGFRLSTHGARSWSVRSRSSTSRGEKRIGICRSFESLVDGHLSFVDERWLDFRSACAAACASYCSSGEFMTKTTHALVRAAGVLLAASTAMAATTLVAQTAQVVSGTSSKAKLGTWGVDLTSRDTSVKPGDDFQKFASGSWLAKTQIPADKPEVGSFYEVYDISQDQLKAVVTSAPADEQIWRAVPEHDGRSASRDGRHRAAEGRPGGRCGDQEQDRIRAAHGCHRRNLRRSIVRFHLEPDTADATMNALYLNQAASVCRTGIITCRRSSSRSVRLTALTSSGRSGDRHSEPGCRRARASSHSRPAIAQKSWPSRRPPRHRQDQQSDEHGRARKYAPGLDWAAFFAGGESAVQKRIIVDENSAIRRHRRDLCEDAAHDAQGVAGVPHRRPGRALPQQGDGRQPVPIYQDAHRRDRDPSALEARDRSGRRLARRAGRPGLCRALLPGCVQGARWKSSSRI